MPMPCVLKECEARGSFVRWQVVNPQALGLGRMELASVRVIAMSKVGSFSSLGKV